MSNDAGIKAADAVEAARLCAMLNDGEREALVLAAKGYGCKQIGMLSGVGHKAIEKRRGHVMFKLGVDTIIEAAVIATKAGLV